MADSEQRYGGGGGTRQKLRRYRRRFATLKLTLPLPPGSVTGGATTIRFRFNHSDGLASGFRVLDFNFIAVDGGTVLPAAAFSREDPKTWKPPLDNPNDVSAGKALWYTAPLVANNRPGAPAIHAHCADCHAQDGRDLKYFNFSNASIAARAQFHGLSARQGEQVASYIRSLHAPNPGRPWNPPYQPGPGLELEARDRVGGWRRAFIRTGKRRRVAPVCVRPGPAAAADHAGDLPSGRATANPREIPISLQLPDWNHWLPRVHPLDAWGPDFPSSELNRLYGGPDGVRAQLASPQLAKLVSSGDIVTLFDKWNKSQRKFLARYAPRNAADWSPDLTNKVYSTQLWQLVKAWELANEFQLEGRGQEFYGAAGEPRTWFNTIPLSAAPAEAGIPDGPNGMGGSALTNEYFDNAWYEVQILVNSGNHRRHARQPVDSVYVIDHVLDMYRESHRPEPARLLVAAIKAMQFSDPKAGPDNQLKGWRPDDTVDPRIMVSRDWIPVFQPLPPDVRRGITEAMLTAWLDKNFRYRTAQYFMQGTTGRSYVPSKELATITGGKVWEAATSV